MWLAFWRWRKVRIMQLAEAIGFITVVNRESLRGDSFNNAIAGV